MWELRKSRGVGVSIFQKCPNFNYFEFVVGGSLKVQWHLSFITHLPFFLHTFGEGGGLKTVEWKSPKLVVPINKTQILRHNCVQLVT